MDGASANCSIDNENLCVVCCKTVEYYSVGECDHPVCFECGTRMRVLCYQNECPICRRQMPKVIFSEENEPFIKLQTQHERTDLRNHKYGIIFANVQIQKAYQRLLENRCTICARFYPTFNMLKDHLRREHNQTFCELCVNNLKIFPFERRSYTKQELGYHRRKGDPDNTSHRGHPLCEFCETRFMDSDELFRHLRRDHLFCHYCDADGKHQYYNSMDDLINHFREEHYLCEEGECKTLPLAAVFKTDIDLKAHIATEHSRHMSKLATKQARTLELEFTLAPRPRQQDRNRRQMMSTSTRNDSGGGGGSGAGGGGGGGLSGEFDLGAFGGGGGGGGERGGGGNIIGNTADSNTNRTRQLTAQDFPALGNATTSGTITLPSRPRSTINFMSRVNPFSGQDFPSLGGSRGSGSNVTITTSSAPSRSKKPDVTITGTVRGGANPRQQPLVKNTENFPTLGPPSVGAGTTSTVCVNVNSDGNTASPKVSIYVNHNSNSGATTTTHITASTVTPSTSKVVEAFPTLPLSSSSSSSDTVTAAKWVTTKQKKQQQQELKVGKKVAPPPQLPPSDLSQFPVLNRSKPVTGDRKKSSVTMPVSAWSGEGATSPTKTATPAPSSSKTNNNNNSSSKIVNNNSNNSISKSKKQKKKSALTSNDEKSILVAPSNEAASTKNGIIVKKRSELKIGSLTIKSTDNNDKMINEGKPPPPPGFPTLKKPPPGFNLLSSSNDLTFTNSSGQSYAINPTTHDYFQPSNFTVRNSNLIQRFRNLLNNNTERINEFKHYSTLFREDHLTPQSYLEHCKLVLDEKFAELFPELLILLPDIKKQQELYNVIEDKMIKKNLIVCEQCKQIISKFELSEHYNHHRLDSQFPSLNQTMSESGLNNNNNNNNAWKK